MSFKPTVTVESVASGVTVQSQTCALCIGTIRKGEPKFIEIFSWPDGDIRRFHYHVNCFTKGGRALGKEEGK